MRKLFILLLSIAATASYAQPEKMKVALDNYLQQYHEVRQLSGVVLIGMQGHTMYKQTLGWIDPKTKIKLTGQEKFGIGSTTKLFTALLVMQQVEKGELKLDDPVSKWLPALKVPNVDQITIKHLLQHTSGLGNYMNLPMYGKLMMFGKIRTIDDLLPLIEDMPAPKQAPGVTYYYSNSGYILLGKILEKATGKNYHELLKQGILNPLKLKDTFTELLAKNSTLAQPYRFIDNNHFIHYPNPDTLRCFPDGGLLMSADDLAQFGNALINHKIVKHATLQQMISDTVRADKKSWYGLGIIIEKIDGKLWIGHDGFSRGYSVDLKIIPEEKGFLISMFNNNGVSSVQINTSIIGMIDGKAPIAPKPYLWKVIYEQFKRTSNLTLTDLNSILKEKGYTPFASPMQVINLTNDLAEAGMLEISLELLQFNQVLFPNEGVSYKALGEAYVDMKNTKKAIESFQQALKINPNDEYANRRLKELGAL